MADNSNSPHMKKVRIGDLLVQNKIISENQLMEALKQQKSTGRKLGRMLIDLGFVQEKQLLDLLSEQLGIPFIEIEGLEVDSNLISLIPETMARRFRVMVLRRDLNGLLVGMADPTDIFAYDEVSRVLRQSFNIAVIRESSLLDKLDSAYRRTSEIYSIAQELHGEITENEAFSSDTLRLEDASDENDSPVMRLLNKIFEDAMQVKASDIHIEPDAKVVRIRQRIDGVLHEQVMDETKIMSALVVRLKLMSGLDISEKRIPQDGRFNIKVNKRSLDVRLSTMPVQHGESLVMRLLDHSDGIKSLNDSGMPEEMLKRFRKMIRRPHGLVLVTGPTGSGKTTTLYGALDELNTPERKIITCEDPVEYSLPRVSQVQVHEKIGLDFAKVLRSALRQDPDVLLVGEIRDKQSAEIALKAAMTGHLVLSTLHTNDAISSALRLVDIGVDGYIVATALNAVVAQRLVRRICHSCGREHQPNVHELEWLRAYLGKDQELNYPFRKGVGCSTCNNTGYKGRIGIYEYIEINEPMADALRANDVSEFSIAACSVPGYRTLTDEAFHYAKMGTTTMDEVIRVSAMSD